jgi:hypothetical protein
MCKLHAIISNICFRFFKIFYHQTMTVKFLVVYTVESAKATKFDIHVVPATWIDRKILYYPPTSWGTQKVNQLLKGCAPVDKTAWRMYSCIVHKKKFDSFETAEKFVRKIIECPANGTDSEADNGTLNTLLKMQAGIKKKNKKG